MSNPEFPHNEGELSEMAFGDEQDEKDFESQDEDDTGFGGDFDDGFNAGGQGPGHTPQPLSQDPRDFHPVESWHIALAHYQGDEAAARAWFQGMHLRWIALLQEEQRDASSFQVPRGPAASPTIPHAGGPGHQTGSSGLQAGGHGLQTGGSGLSFGGLGAYPGPSVAGLPVAPPAGGPPLPHPPIPTQVPHPTTAPPTTGLPVPTLPPTNTANPLPGTGIIPPAWRADPAQLLFPRANGNPPASATWPRNIDITLVEICTFSPDWFHLPEAIARTIRNNWSREAIAKAQLHAENNLVHPDFLRRAQKIQKQISYGGKLLQGQNPNQGGLANRFRSETFRNQRGPQNDLTANAWNFRDAYQANQRTQQGHMELRLFWQNTVNWPTGNDRGIMTQCLEFARRNPQLMLDTSHWDWIMQNDPTIVAPPPPVGGQHPDREALTRLHANVQDP